MRNGPFPDKPVPAAERLRIVIDRHVNLDENTPGHHPNARARMMRDNEIACLQIFHEAWGGAL